MNWCSMLYLIYPYSTHIQFYECGLIWFSYKHIYISYIISNTYIFSLSFKGTSLHQPFTPPRQPGSWMKTTSSPSKLMPRISARRENGWNWGKSAEWPVDPGYVLHIGDDIVPSLRIPINQAVQWNVIRVLLPLRWTTFGGGWKKALPWRRPEEKVFYV